VKGKKEKRGINILLKWDFESSRFNDDIVACGFPETGDEKFGCTVVGRDPGIVYGTKQKLDAGGAKYIYAKYRTTCESETAQFYFATDLYPAMSEKQSKTYTISPNSPSYEYIIDMSDKPEWKGILNQLRFDPVGYDNRSEVGECMVEYIEVSDRFPVYGNKKDFIGTQGANNWSYHTFDGELAYREMQWDSEDGSWRGIYIDGLIINADIQTSRAKYASVKRWMCPAGGKYSVKCTFEQISHGYLTDFAIKRNHVVLQKYRYSAQNRLSGEYAGEFELEKGETLNFEFCNENYYSVVYLDADIGISKMRNEE